jgi:hypothetical protein
MKILSNLISPDECAILAKAVQEQSVNKTGDSLVPISHSAYGLRETEDLLLNLTEKISYITNKSLVPTYSYSRVYLKGANMPNHTDRPACEYSLSIRLAGDEWPLWFDIGIPTPVQLEIGSGILYLGMEIPHWREAFTGNSCTQVFLHWVDADGSFADWRFDRRPSIGSKESEKAYLGKS